MAGDGATTSTVTGATTQQQAAPASRPPSGPAPRLSGAGWGIVGILLYLLQLDAAVETLLARSPARWIVGGIVLAYLALSVLVRRRLAARTRAGLSLIVIVALLAFSAWQPAGLSSGIVMLRQPPGTVLSAVTALAIVLAAWTLVRAAFLPAVARFAAAALGAYGLAAIVLGIVAATPYPALVHGQSAWTRLPFWLQGAFVGGAILLPAALLLQAGSALAGRKGRSRGGDLLLALASALSLAIVAAGFAAPGHASGTAAGAGENGPGLRPLTVASLKLPVPRTPDLAHVEPENFAAALGKDPIRIFEFVRDQVAYEPYAGCLRGPRGTLLALAGNSVDRAALLASLLVKAGHRARFVQGELPEGRAQDLVASVFVGRPEAAPAGPPPEGTGKAAADALLAGIERDARLLGDNLKRAGLPGRADVTTLDSMAQEARRHCWVQWWRDGAWVDMDPSFATAVPGIAYARPVTTFDALPDSLFHRVDLRIRLEEYTAGKPATREILRYSARAADLSGADLVLVHSTERAKARARESGLGSFSSGTAPAQPGQVKPLLIVRGQVNAGSPFWQTAPRQAASAGFDSLLGGGGGEEPAAVPVAVAESVQLDFVSPDGRTDSIVREVFDLVGPALRRKGEALRASDVAARTAAAGSRGLTDTIYDLFVTTGAVHAAHLENVVTPPPPPAGEPIDLQAGLQRVNVFFAATSDRLLDRLATADGGVCRFYVDSPRVQIAELSVGASDMRLSMDLRRDQARAVGVGVRKEQLFGAQVLRGVADGNLERVLIDFFNSPDAAGSAPAPAAMSTSLVFEIANASKPPITLLEKDATALAADVPADGRARVEQALAAGAVALAPRGPVAVAGAPRFAWWQVDPRSGITTAVTDAGLHQATVELVIVESRENGKAVVFEGAAEGQGALSRACAHPTNFQNGTKAYEYARSLMDLMKSTGQKYHFTHYLTDFAL